MNYDPFEANSFVWPLTFLLICLFILRGAEKRMGPIVDSMVGGVAKNAQSNATAYAIATMFGLSASLSALGDEAQKLGWFYVVVACKVLNPFIVAVLAYATQNKFGSKGTNTTPPFSPTPNP